jgi:hypothetical protein
MTKIALFIALHAMDRLSVSAPARLLFLWICHGYWLAFYYQRYKKREKNTHESKIKVDSGYCLYAYLYYSLYLIIVISSAQDNPSVARGNKTGPSATLALDNFCCKARPACR